VAFLEVISLADGQPREVTTRLGSVLASGSLLGPDLVVGQPDPGCVQFTARSGFLDGVPDRGTFFLSRPEGAGGTEVRCQLWCRGLRARGFLVAATAGILASTAGALVFNWLISVSIPVGAGVALLADGLIWFRQRTRLRRRIETYLSGI
jgi:hypothetical protein